MASPEKQVLKLLPVYGNDGISLGSLQVVMGGAVQGLLEQTHVKVKPSSAVKKSQTKAIVAQFVGTCTSKFVPEPLTVTIAGSVISSPCINRIRSYVSSVL